MSFIPASKSLLTFGMAVLVLLTSSPHVFCCCGSYWGPGGVLAQASAEAEEKSEPTCSCCHKTSSEKTSSTAYIGGKSSCRYFVVDSAPMAGPDARNVEGQVAHMVNSLAILSDLLETPPVFDTPDCSKRAEIPITAPCRCAVMQSWQV